MKKRKHSCVEPTFHVEHGGAVSNKATLQFPTLNLHGLRIQAIQAQDLLAIISEGVRTDSKYVVANHNMHGLYVWQRSSEMRELHARADFIHIDGLPLIALFRIFGLRLRREHRTAYIEFLYLVAEEALKQRWKIYYLGSKPDVIEQGAAVLRRRFPGLQLRTHHGYFDVNGAENQMILRDIGDYAPDVLLVGMGMPRQEAWINDNLPQITAKTIFCAGCTMDYVAGATSACPRWLGNSGLEWFYRLLVEPGRLWRRYLLEPWFVLAHLARLRFAASSAVEVSPTARLDSGE